MKRFATIALAVLFVTSLTGAAMAERTGLSITGGLEIMARQDENLARNTVAGGRVSGIGTNGADNRVEEKINLNVDADLTDNVGCHIGLEQTGAWGAAQRFELTQRQIDGQARALAIDEAYIEVKELFIEQLTVKAGVMSAEYSLRDDGNSMFLSLAELGAWSATVDYDPLYVDLIIGKQVETRINETLIGAIPNETDRDIYALVMEYYLENESKIQVIIALVNDDDDDLSLTQYSAGCTYNVLDDLEVYGQIGGQSGEADGYTGIVRSDFSGTAYQIGAKYTFANVAKTPYVGLEYQSFSGDDDLNGDANWVALGDVDSTIVLEADRDLRDHGLGTVGKLLVSNYSAIRILGGCVIDEKTKIDGQIAIFSKAEEDSTTDSRVGGAQVALLAGVKNGVDGVTTTDAAIGTEIDVMVTYQLTDDLTVSAGVGYVASGDAIEDQSDINYGGIGLGGDDALVSLLFTATLDF